MYKMTITNNSNRQSIQYSEENTELRVGKGWHIPLQDMYKQVIHAIVNTWPYPSKCKLNIHPTAPLGSVAPSQVLHSPCLCKTDAIAYMGDATGQSKSKYKMRSAK